eukprot:CAMPEP_0203006454 /NCGR_PEP_ID=MMETSP1401-20130829/4654_1 /ASSEMBLY_ACC=CAM_ASM_000894 /TAXON_ID=38833 /ORGANISM="Micromonas pusilla, Strain CCAC1681" /LENGTH=68 /DNA_ID=CAMNT_0049748099 /DNA_START=64 /DNA_END=266 /DNA_ORIENTATION=+
MAAMLSSSAALAPGARLLNARARKSVGAPRAVPARVVATARVDDAETTIALRSAAIVASAAAVLPARA